MARCSSDWGLFVDWCASVGEQPIPASVATVLAFFDDVAGAPRTLARRAKAIDALHLAGGAGAPGRGAMAELRRATQRYDTQNVNQALRDAPVGGWPTGLVGRRDAALVALVCLAGSTRRQALMLRLHDIEPALARLSVGVDVGTCQRCALTRWARARWAVSTSGWRAVRYEMEDIGSVLAGMATSHDCARPLPAPMPDDGPLFSAIDRWGQVELVTPLSTRSVSAIISSCLAAACSEGRELANTPVPSLRVDERAAQLRRLDALCEAMERAEELAGRYLGVQPTLST